MGSDLADMVSGVVLTVIATLASSISKEEWLEAITLQWSRGFCKPHQSDEIRAILFFSEDFCSQLIIMLTM